ncbi:helix-turn-helix transcriptional regulator [Actinoplanes sp. NPDC049596]|uniref:helix-turn-helix transcriptional regulator n=1 Tax=unclassified Actinoplanes TaxID=2626549 RepID=UPI00341667B8
MQTTHEVKFTELGSFLAARRAEVTPAEVGLPSSGSRRLSGLRREEVAMLAGVGVSWYAWIEQGRAKNVSPGILTSIADVLRLGSAQRRYMMRLAGYAPPAERRSPPAHDFGRCFVDGFLPNPAYFMDCYWNVVAANTTAARLLGLDVTRTNYLTLLFGDPEVARRFPHWEKDAADAVARLRSQSVELLGDAALENRVAALREMSPTFARLWDRHHLTDELSTVQTVRHPELGQESFERLTLEVAARPGYQLVLLRPRTDRAAAGLRRWAAEGSSAG